MPPATGGRVWSEQLALWLDYDEDGFLRLYTRGGEMLLTQREEAQQRMDAERRLAELTAELERLRRGNSSG